MGQKTANIARGEQSADRRSMSREARHISRHHSDTGLDMLGRTTKESFRTAGGTSRRQVRYVSLCPVRTVQSSWVSTVTRLRTGRQGFNSQQKQGIFLFTTASRLVLGPTQPPIQWVSEIKRLEVEAGHSPPSSAEVKNAWSYTSTSQYVFMAWCLIKHRDNFTSTEFPNAIFVILHPSLVLMLRYTLRPLYPKRKNPAATYWQGSWVGPKFGMNMTDQSRMEPEAVIFTDQRTHTEPSIVS
jgi:hypothetical protein